MVISTSKEPNPDRLINIIEVLNRTSLQLIDVKEEAEIYKIIAQASKQILPGAFFLVTKLQVDDMNFRIIESVGLEKYISKIISILGKDPFTIDFPFKDLTDQQLKAYESRKIYHFPGGIFDVSNGVLNKAFCRTVELLLGVGDVCAMSFYVEKKHFGGITMFIPNDLIKSGLMSNDAELAIETLSNMASSVIQKMRDHKDLIISKNKIESEQANYNRLLSQLTDIVWKANPDGTEVRDLNNTFEKYYGIPASAFNTDPEMWIKMVHPDDRQIAYDSSNELYRTGNSVAEYRILTPEGKIVWLNDRKSILFDKNGQAIEMGGVASDITERKLLIEELRVKNYALDNSPIATAFANFQEEIFYANNAFVQLFGYDNQEEILRRPLREFSTSSTLVEKVISTIRGGGIFTGEGMIESRDGTLIPIILSATMVKHQDQPICLKADFVDIRERKNIESALKDQADYLAEANATKDKFFSIIAHDLKGPLSGFANLTRLIVEDFDKLSFNKMLDFMTSLRNSAENVYNLLENLLEWSRLQSGMIKYNPADLMFHSFLANFLHTVEDSANSKGISIIMNVPTDLTIACDEMMMAATMRNLVTNSIKFTPRGGNIIISAYSTENRTTIVSVKDSGIGMSESLMDKLFRIDQKIGRPGTEGESSSGLGLLLCKEFIEKHHGRIWVESVVDEGSTFFFEIPVR